ncbi:hypothetical protein HRR83_002345 [Exophiala dermatitidis]|uniref:Uncharacterized protein n=2 Tax=Exophiala dermatitidis TaxID=5970 RepID=H6BXP3_EXODN|nr:uncharacterized protein HMPREF1120_04648 [Exophiala dermatitidis NIH/UT8656]KAJ4524225.1 hypothetical protein HRR74_002422 [Exophiala dermatitidis]EHY56570.1 hypothetical protein HMPREF1120_04648 [Exophiala dermatitidis NIH/UT8656]KAJ4525502.1 hypothetical protein HRR73_002232 [Exophiala dermatitidis]KAJ4536819.1 hypothetical protein HRR76_004845 [Exophiala dermatitidis]KAJ4555579.1 hypothetical protein HRR77_001509 [Exophiala dermatitidis]
MLRWRLSILETLYNLTILFKHFDSLSDVTLPRKEAEDHEQGPLYTYCIWLFLQHTVLAIQSTREAASSSACNHLSLAPMSPKSNIRHVFNASRPRWDSCVSERGRGHLTRF